MPTENELNKTVELYQQAAQENPNIDVASLMVSALKNQKQNLVPSPQKKWAYLISIGLPPFGVLIALKFYFFDSREDAKSLAYTCLILTVFSLFLVWLTAKMFQTPNLGQIKQIDQAQIKDAAEFLH